MLRLRLPPLVSGTPSGSGNATEAPDVVSGSGASGSTSSGSATSPVDTASGSGASGSTGSGAYTETADAASGSGAKGSTASGSATEAADTASGTGTAGSGAIGSGAATEAQDNPNGSGQTGSTGSGAATEAADPALGSGITGVAIIGAAAITEAADNAAGTGASGSSGAGAAIEPPDVASGTAAVPNPGRTLDTYLRLIPPLHATKPKFRALLSSLVGPLITAQHIAALLPAAFDIDDAAGVQLDIVGEWIGRSRIIATPLPDVFFAFDIPGRGFDQAVWRGPFDSERGLTTLDDDTYRKLLKAKILANSWDGSIPGATAILNAFFDDPATFVFAEDVGGAIRPGNWFAFDTVGRGFNEGAWHRDGDEVSGAMAMIVTVAGHIPTALDLALLAGGYLPIKPAAVRVEYAVTSVEGAPVFGFDADNDHIGGFDHGAFGVSPDDARQYA